MNQIFKNGWTVLFQGDSITDCGRDYEDPESLGNGYPKKVAEVHRSLFPDANVRFLNRGVSGNRSCDLLSRYEADLKQLRPDFLSILIGINDVWRRYDHNDATSAEQFEKNYRTLLTNLKRDLPDTRIMIIEPYLLYTVSERRSWRVDLDPKIDIVRSMAKEFADYYLPMDGIFISHLTRGMEESSICADGIHPCDAGHGIIAAEYLKCLGLNEG